MGDKPYLLISDTHFHNWTAFADTNGDGINSRLAIQLQQMDRAYAELKAAGGNLVFHAGDLFHVRGQIKPSVINPVVSFFKESAHEGFETAILSGNHDLESNDATDLTSAVSAVGSSGIAAINLATVFDPPKVIMIPWHSSLDSLRTTLQSMADSLDNPGDYDIIIHAPMNGVLVNIPEKGLNASDLMKYGFKRVFCGHYHNHRNFEDKVFSVGALTHQTWGDVGSQAGFCLVYPDRVQFFASTAPAFMPVPVGAEEDLVVEVEGNYVRADIDDPTPSRIEALKKYLLDNGAAGVTVRTIVSETTSREGGETVTAMDSLEESIFKYSEKHYSKPVAAICADILKEVQSL